MAKTYYVLCESLHAKFGKSYKKGDALTEAHIETKHIPELLASGAIGEEKPVEVKPEPEVKEEIPVVKEEIPVVVVEDPPPPAETKITKK